MKFLTLVMCLVFSTLASAESILVLEERSGSGIDYSAEFSVNKTLGRAWVTVTEARSAGETSYYYETKVLIAGLSYDAETKEVIYTRGSEKIVCGELYNKPWVIDIGGSIKNSERCRFEVVKIRKDIDNGFEIKSKKFVKVTLIIE